MHHARLGADQATDDPEQGAFAAAVAADKHPQSRSGDCEAAAFESFGSTGPAVADPVETQSCLGVFTCRAHAGSDIQGEARTLASTCGGGFFINLNCQQIAGEHTEAFAFNLLAGEFEQPRLPLFEGRPHLLVQPFCSIVLLPLHGNGHRAHAQSQLNHVHGRVDSLCSSSRMEGRDAGVGISTHVAMNFRISAHRIACSN